MFWIKRLFYFGIDSQRRSETVRRGCETTECTDSLLFRVLWLAERLDWCPAPSSRLAEDAGVAANPVKYWPKCVEVLGKSRRSPHLKEFRDLHFAVETLQSFTTVFQFLSCFLFNEYREASSHFTASLTGLISAEPPSTWTVACCQFRVTWLGDMLETSRPPFLYR